MKSKDKLRSWETAALLTLCVFLLSGVFAHGRQAALSDKVIRLHVIAASDSAEDQAVKLAVRDAVLRQLAPVLSDAASPEAAAVSLASLLPEIERIAGDVSGGEAHALLGRESYPTREYEDFSLPAGMYTSLRIVLGNGQGHNWWCVVYPPLCSGAFSEAVEAGSFSEDDVKLITEDGAPYAIRFRLIEWWEKLLK